MAHCIYCQRPGKKSREHVFPEFLLKASGRQGLFYSNSAGHYFDSDAVVRDTCIPCNTGPLSMLDAYAKTLYSQYFSRVLVDSRTMTYDSDKLFRWVLKVTFNAQRGFAGISEPFFHLRPYMLGESERPASLIYLGVVMKRSFVEGRWKTPRDLRASDIRIPELALQLEIKFCHMLVINSFCFLVADIINPTSERRARLIDFLSKSLGAQEIKADEGKFTFDAKASKIDHVSHNVFQSAKNPKAFPESREVIVGEERIRLTGLPDGHFIERDRVRDTKLALVTLDEGHGVRSACLAFFEFPEMLHEMEQSIANTNHTISKRCFAGIKRGQSKTFLTLYDPYEPGAPYLSSSTGIEQSKESWGHFKEAITSRGCLFLGDQKILKGSAIAFNCVAVVSIEYV